MSEYQTHAALAATLEAEIARRRAVNAGLMHAARQALEALRGLLAIADDSQGVAGYHLNGEIEPWSGFPEVEEVGAVITALREALEAVPQPAAVDQEPVAYASRIDTNWPVLWSAYQVKRGDAQYPERLTPLYTAPQPAAAEQRPVAHRVMRKTLDGKWVCDGRYWFDGPPSKELVESICADKNRWRVDVAYTTPQPGSQPLTEDRLVRIVRNLGWGQSDFDVVEVLELARAIEKAHGIGGEA